MYCFIVYKGGIYNNEEKINKIFFKFIVNKMFNIVIGIKNMFENLKNLIIIEIFLYSIFINSGVKMLKLVCFIVFVV